MKINSKVAVVVSMIIVMAAIALIIRLFKSCGRISPREMLSSVEECGCTNHSDEVSCSHASGANLSKSVITIEMRDRKEDRRNDGLSDRHTSLLKKIGVIRE